MERLEITLRIELRIELGIGTGDMDTLESLTKLNMCISDIRVWMIKNK